MFEKFKKLKNKQVEETSIVTSKLSKKQMKQKEMYIKEIMAQNKLPIVILDAQWYKIKPLIQTEHILKNEQLLLGYIKEQGALTNQLKEDNVLKQNLLQEVLVVSGKLNDEGDTSKLKDLENLHQGIVKLGESLKKDEERLQEIEKLIVDTNTEILQEVVALGYEYMEVCKGESETLQNEMDSLREKLLEKTTEKKKYDSHAAVLYNYLHNIVGYKHIDKVDKVLGDK